METAAEDRTENNGEGKDGAERLADSETSDKCSVCLEVPLCGIAPFACQHAMCLACIDIANEVHHQIRQCPVCRSDAWVFPLDVKATGSDRERAVVDSVVEMLRNGQNMQATIHTLEGAISDRELERYAEDEKKRLMLLTATLQPLQNEIVKMASRVVSDSTRQMWVQAGTKMAGLWCMFLIAIASQSIALVMVLMVLSFMVYIGATEYVSWAERTHGKLLSQSVQIGNEIRAQSKKYALQQQRERNWAYLNEDVVVDNEEYGGGGGVPVYPIHRARQDRRHGNGVVLASSRPSRAVRRSLGAVGPGGEVQLLPIRDNIASDVRMANRVMQEN